MLEQHNTTIAIFGGKPGEDIEFKGNCPVDLENPRNLTDHLFAGMAGNQVLEWADLDTEIKTAGVKDVSVFVPFFAKTFTDW